MNILREDYRKAEISEAKMKYFLGIGHWFLFQDTFAIKDAQTEAQT